MSEPVIPCDHKPRYVTTTNNKEGDGSASRSTCGTSLETEFCSQNPCQKVKCGSVIPVLLWETGNRIAQNLEDSSLEVRISEVRDSIREREKEKGREKTYY